MNIKKRVLTLSLPFLAFSVIAAESETITVTANLFPQPVSSVLAPVDIVTRDDIDRWQPKDLTDILKRLPGIDIAQNGGRGQLASIFVRGTESKHVLVLIDGLRMASQGVNNSIDFSQIPVALIQRIEYIRGARSAVYGSDAVGGVINIITTRDQDGGELNASYGTNAYQNYNGSVKQTIDENTSISLAGGYESTKGYNAYPSSINPVDQDRDGFRSKSLWIQFDHTFSEKFAVFARGLGYRNSTEYDKTSLDDQYYTASNERDLDSRNYDIGLRFKNGQYSSQLVASYEKYKDADYDKTLGKGATKSDRFADLEQYALQWGNNYKLFDGVLSFGADWRNEKVKEGSFSLKSDQSRYNTGAYITTQQYFFDSIILEAAIRGDNNQQFGRYGTWHTALGWDFIQGYRASLSYSTAYKAPSFGEVYNTAWNEENGGLKPEKSKQWELGLEGNTRGVFWRLSAYHNDIEDLITSKEIATWRYKYFNIKKAVVKGVEWEMKFETGPLTHTLDIEWIKPIDSSTGKDLLKRPREKFKYQLDWTIFNLDMDIAYSYNGKRYDNGYVRLPSYSTVDITASYPIHDNFIIRGKIANLFDKDYETTKGYATAGREYTITASYNF